MGCISPTLNFFHASKMQKGGFCAQVVPSFGRKQCIYKLFWRHCVFFTINTQWIEHSGRRGVIGIYFNINSKIDKIKQEFYSFVT